MKLFLILLFLGVSQTSSQSIKFLLEGQSDSANSPFPIITTNAPTVDRGLRSAFKACVTGKWIFYNEVNYGFGLENKADAEGIPFPGERPGRPDGECFELEAAGITIADIRSIRLISGPLPAANSHLAVFSEANYLGPLKMATGGAANLEIRLGSFIFTRGNALLTWEFCSSNDCLTGNNICIDQRFMEPGVSVVDVSNDTTIVDMDNNSTAVLWPRIVRTIRHHANSGLCTNSAQHVGSSTLLRAYLRMKMLTAQQ